MSGERLISQAKNTWCPGCGNFAIQHAIRQVLLELEAEGHPLHQFALITGIGCHAKMADYFSLNSIYAIHGRTLPVATGLKLARPELKVICCAGDGDAYAEGLDHLIFAAKRNVDVTMIVHNNRVYGLTTGQYTPTSPLGFRGRSTPAGTSERPFNPLSLVIASGGGFVARGYTRRLPQLKSILKEALQYRGFSFVDVLQICATFFDVHEAYDRLVYEPESHDPSSRPRAMSLAEEWDYNSEGPIPLGILYRKEMPVFGERFVAMGSDTGPRGESIQALLRERR